MAWEAIQCVLVAAQLHLEWLWAAWNCMGDNPGWGISGQNWASPLPIPLPHLRFSLVPQVGCGLGDNF